MRIFLNLVDGFGFFFCSGEGKEESEAPGGEGVAIFYRKGGSRGWAGGGARGREGVCGGSGGGGLNIFFRGRNVHRVKYSLKRFFGKKVVRRPAQRKPETHLFKSTTQLACALQNELFDPDVHDLGRVHA